jgi:hypothetical protein
MSLLEVENQTKKYADLYSGLTDLLTDMDKEVKWVQDKYRVKIKEEITKLKSTGENLKSLLEENKGSFEKPKTQIFFNIRVGFMKGKGKKEFNNAKTVELIKKYLSDKKDSLIKIEETVISKALDTLTAIELKKVGVHIEDAQDEIVIRPVDTEIQKAVNKIISEIIDKEDPPVIILGGKAS